VPHMAAIRVSVIVPTCHRNDLLAKCLDCLAPGVQTLPAEQYEVIVTDDGSKSTAEAMVTEQYPWARWVAGPQKGPAANRNNGIKSALGKWLVFTDDDCLADHNWLQAFALAITADIYVYEGRTVCYNKVLSPLYASPINLKGGYLWSCNMMVEASAYNQIGGFDESYPYACMEDVDFRERLKDFNYSFQFVLDAVTDHPAQLRPRAQRLAMMHESQVVFWFKRRQHVPSIISHLYGTCCYNLRHIKRCPMGRDSIKAFIKMVVELIMVAMLMKSWIRKHSSLQ